MAQNLSEELNLELLLESPGRLDYTQKAFSLLPKLDKPNILDVGCGTGEPTIMLAKMSNGVLTGIDIDQGALDELKRKAKEQNLSDRIKTVKMSMFNLDFPDKTFDIIWAEGAIFHMGFKKGLMEWKRLLKPNGFLAVHEMCWVNQKPPIEIQDHWKWIYPGIATHQKNLEMIRGCGYKVIGHFTLPEDAWWKFYFGPLQERITKLREKYKDDLSAQKMLDKEQKEVDLYRKYSKWYGSAYYIIQKI